MKPSEAAQLLLNAAGLGIRLHDWQKKFIDDQSRFRILLKHRGAGATFTIALEAVTASLLQPSTTTILLSYSMRQSLEIFRHVKTILTHLENTTIKHNGKQAKIKTRTGERNTHLSNGSRIISLPNNPETLRGYRADAVYVDEAALFRDDFTLRTAVMFTTVARTGRVTLVSTPKGKRGWFYQSWVHGNEWSKHFVRLGDSPHLSERDLTELRKVMTDLEWRQEMECEFLDEVNAFIPYDKILAAVEDYVPSRTGVDGRVFLGVDFGRYRDSTVLVGVAEDGGRLRICYLEELKQAPFAAQLETVKKAAELLRPSAVVVDSTGMGAPLAEALSKVIPSTTPITITAPVKTTLVNNLRNMILNQKLVIPADETKLINQLRLYQQINTGIGFKYEAPAGEHDDYVMALALAVYAAQTSSTPKVEATFFWKWKSPQHLTP
ncbi:MAG: terminase family protein [Candidatus Caldarchaeum sp.]|nr:terminase family protein [Candidatus Caldarchaeum sp.]MDW8063912.1 terminase family protein [Candidatus Caldarchaeum sp.]MDW8434780.1 terminase family protein [Candidatus Caldarchaeum sp.]